MFLGILKKTSKNVKTYVCFTGRLITQHLITQLQEISTGKSRTQENVQLRTVCDKCL